MKKFSLFVICLELISSVFTACSGTDAGNAAGSSGTSVAQVSSASAAKREISYMAWYTTETEPENILEVIDKFNAFQENINVKLVSVSYADYVIKLNTMAASNSLPDTAMMMEAQTLKWAVNGKLLDVSNMYTGDNKPLDSLGFRYNGKVVAYSASNEVLLLYYNKDIFDKAGVSYPPASADKAWTWQQFVNTAQKLTVDKNGKAANDLGFDPQNIVTYGCYFNTLDWMWPVLAISNGGGLISQDGKELLLGKPETIEAAQDIADLNLKYHVAPTPAEMSSFPTFDVTLLSGKVAMATSGQWEIGTSIRNSIKKGLHYGVGVLPILKTPVTLNTGGPNVIFNTTKNPEASKMFLQWFTDENNNLSLIQSGVWMPTKKKWYTDESLIEIWAKNDVHPPIDEYKPAVIDYAMNNAQQVPWYFFPGYAEMEVVLASGMDTVWTGKKTAKDIILNDILPKIQPIFDQNKIK